VLASVNQPALQRGMTASLFQERGHLHEVGPCAHNRCHSDEASRGFMIPALAVSFIHFFPSDPVIIGMMNWTPHRGNGRILVGAVLHMFVDPS
jgi:hypothetical protein